MLTKHRSKVLLGRRLSPHGYGTWSFPGGKPRSGESAAVCALRELQEETGIAASNARLIGLTLDAFPASSEVFKTTFVRVEVEDADPVVREPEKSDLWRWFDWDDLPQPLFTPIVSLVATGYEPVEPRDATSSSTESPRA